MIACYVQGAGLGHLTRLRAYLHTVRPDGSVTVLTGSPFAADRRLLADPRAAGEGPEKRPRAGGAELAVVGLPAGPDRDALRDRLAETLARLAPAELVVDAFPAGLYGELDRGVVPPGVRITHLARLLRWEEYRPLLGAAPLRFDRTWLVEPVSAGHLAHLRAVSRSVAPLTLTEPPSAGPDPAAVETARASWLIVHSGPAEETAELIGYARDTAALERVRPRLVLVAPARPAALPADVAHLDACPAWPLFPYAERIITAAGCNAVRQLAELRGRHRMLPFPRRFDDQFARAAMAKAT